MQMMLISGFKQMKLQPDVMPAFSMGSRNPGGEALQRQHSQDKASPVPGQAPVGQTLGQPEKGLCPSQSLFQTKGCIGRRRVPSFNPAEHVR